MSAIEAATKEQSNLIANMVWQLSAQGTYLVISITAMLFLLTYMNGFTFIPSHVQDSTVPYRNHIQFGGKLIKKEVDFMTIAIAQYNEFKKGKQLLPNFTTKSEVMKWHIEQLGSFNVSYSIVEFPLSVVAEFNAFQNRSNNGKIGKYNMSILRVYENLHMLIMKT